MSFNNKNVLYFFFFFLIGNDVPLSGSDNIACGEKSERPKTLDLSDGALTLTVPHLPLPAADKLQEEDEKPPGGRSPGGRPASSGAARRTGIETGFDPLSLMAAPTTRDGDSGAPAARRELAEEIEMYMNGSGSPLSSRAPGTELQTPSSPSLPSATPPHTPPRAGSLLRSHTHLPLPVKPRERLRTSPSLPLGVNSRDRERPSSLVLSSSPTPSSSSFSMDSLLTPTLDIFKSSVISAGKGVAEKASRLYSRLSSQTSLTQVSPAASASASSARDLRPSPLSSVVPAGRGV